MVRLTIDMIARGTTGYTKKKREETMPNYLKRLTHLYLEEKKIDEIGDDLSLCRNVSVLYLYDNQISKIPNLLSNMNLTHLYLQNNQISQIEGLGHLDRLVKLYIGGNNISVVEGLERLENLQELHVEQQTLPAGENVHFDPRTLNAICHSLQVLNVSGNNLSTIRDLQILTYLQHFYCANNKLDDMKELSQVFGALRMMTKLDLSGNPVCERPKYRDRIIVMCFNLDMFDGKEVSPTARTFLQNWKATKDANKDRQRKLSRHRTDVAIYQEKELPPVRAHVSAPTSGYMMPGLPRKQFDEILARSNTQTSGPDGTLGNRKLSDADVNTNVIGEYPDYGLVLKLKQRIQNFPPRELTDTAPE